MLGSKSILTPLIPDCSVLRTLPILKNIRNPRIFLKKWLLTHVSCESQGQKSSYKQACVRLPTF